MVHIEKFVEAANVEKRGPNFFLALKIENNETVFINEWTPVDQRSKETSYRHDKNFRTHFGTFTPEMIEKLPGQLLICDARPHKENAAELFFTTNVKFETAALSPEFKEALEQMESEKKETPVAETKKEDPPVEVVKEQTPIVEQPVKSGRLKCPDCHVFIGKNGHVCKKAKAKVE